MDAMDAMDAMGAADARDTTDAMPPEALHHGYVVSQMFVPTNDTQAQAYGLDLGSKTSSMPDGTVDNAMGAFFTAVNAFSLDIQGTVNTAVDQGSILMLLDLQTTNFLDASAATLGVKLGANPVPAACDSAADTTCRHHFTGTASFSTAPNSPTDALVSGAIVAGTFNGGPGTLVLPIAIGSTTAIKLDLLHARVRASSISANGIMTATVGGLVTLDQIFPKIGPAIQARFQGILDLDCTPGGAGTPPTCGCKAGSTGAMIITAFDGDIPGTAADCTVTTLEIFSYPAIKALLQPDSCALDSCTAADALSLGVKVEAVSATFPM